MCLWIIWSNILSNALIYYWVCSYMCWVWHTVTCELYRDTESMIIIIKSNVKEKELWRSLRYMQLCHQLEAFR